MRVAVITGAASGIGLALSQVYLQKGITVVMVDKDRPKLLHEANQLMSQFPAQIFTIPCDITDTDEVEQLVQLTEKQLGRVDWLYNNAGIIGELAPVWDLKPEQINQVIEVNLYGMINVIRAFIPFLFKQNNPSHIVNMASLYALCSGSQMAPYAMSKHAVLALSESIYFDLKRLEKPVDVSVAFPSFTDTALLSHKASTDRLRFSSFLKFTSYLTHDLPWKLPCI